MNTKVLSVLFVFSIIGSCFVNAQMVRDTEFVRGSRKPKIGLVLSGGGARGLAHVGVLKVLEECGIKPDYITGTSMGSIVGGLYALGYNASEIEKIIKKTDWLPLLTDKITLRDVKIFNKSEYPGYPIKLVFNKKEKPGLPSGMIEGQKIHAFLLKLCWAANKYKNFDDFPIPFRCVATDIISGQPIVFKDGSLADAMRASMSIPSVFAPVTLDTLLLADGGMVRNFPVQECLDMGADIIIGSYTGFNEKVKPEDVHSVLKILTRSSVFQGLNDARMQIPKVDLLIVPNLKGYGPESFSKTNQIMDAGDKAARDSTIYKRLLELAKAHRNAEDSNKKDTSGNIIINHIMISGSKADNNDLIEELCGIYPGTEVNCDFLNTSLEKLYATGEYENASYQLRNVNGNNILIFKLDENKSGKIELGLNFDNNIGTSVLARYTMRDFLVKRSLIKFKVAVSENPRLQLDYDYYLTNGKKLAIFTEASIQTFKMPNVLQNSDTIVELGYYLFNRLNFGVGIKCQLWRNAMVNATLGEDFSAIKMKEGMQYMFNLDKIHYSDFFSMVRLKIDNLDDPFFPMKGISTCFIYKWIIKSKLSNTVSNFYEGDLSNTNEILRFQYKQYFRIKSRFSIIPELAIGMMKKKPFLSDGFYIGGNNYQLFPNSINMSGVESNGIVADNYLKLGIGFQLRVFENYFIQLGQEMLDFIDYKQVYSKDELFRGKRIIAFYAGVGAPTPIGPCRLICSRNIDQKGLYWALNLGIPF